MRILPMFSQKRVFEDWILEIDCRFRRFDSWPLFEVLYKMIDMLKKPDWPNGGEGGDLIGRKLNKHKRESYRKWANGVYDVVIGKKWLFTIGGAICAIAMGSFIGRYEENRRFG